MILEMLLTALYNVFNLLTAAIDIPSLPNKATAMLNQAFTYLSAGVGILANYTDISYLLTLFGVIVGIDVGIAVYHFVMWVIRKIPVVSMS